MNKKGFNHKYSTGAILISMLLMLSLFTFASLSSKDLDDVCGLNNSFFYREPSLDRWVCANFTDVEINFTVNNVTNIFNNATIPFEEQSFSRNVQMPNYNITLAALFGESVNLSQLSIMDIDQALSGVDTGTHRGFFQDIDSDFSGIFDLSTNNWIEQDIDITHSAGTSLTTHRFWFADMTTDINTVLTNDVFKLKVTNLNSGSTFGGDGIYVFDSDVNLTTPVNALQSQIRNRNEQATGASTTAGYQGFANGGDLYTGTLMGVFATTTGADRANRTIGIYSFPLGSGRSGDSTYSFFGVLGNALFNRGSIFSSETNINNIEDSLSLFDYIPANNSGGYGWFENDLEVNFTTFTHNLTVEDTIILDNLTITHNSTNINIDGGSKVICIGSCS